MVSSIELNSKLIQAESKLLRADISVNSYEL
ncbi:hypothetical protein F383_30157 [Gossypium arboreum]|uniref:Uncharacterized protein n=1 Tax=Gossypium arboreum TaxID=29729 RepID=A0A0B0MY01_GOSAR|nr:hypothetical protein F383_30157 [Gossypium arboreum]